jgi:hypothetical protein
MISKSPIHAPTGPKTPENPAKLSDAQANFKKAYDQLTVRVNKLQEECRKTLQLRATDEVKAKAINLLASKAKRAYSDLA